MEAESLQGRDLLLHWEYKFLVLGNIRKKFRKNVRMKIVFHMGNSQERL